MNVKTILSALFILLMSATAMAQTKTADFKGSWSSEGEVPEKGRLELEIKVEFALSAEKSLETRRLLQLSLTVKL